MKNVYLNIPIEKDILDMVKILAIRENKSLKKTVSDILRKEILLRGSLETRESIENLLDQ